MSRYGFDDDAYNQQQMDYHRRLEIEREQEPAWAHARPRNRYAGWNRPGRRTRYFSRLMFRPAQAEPEHVEQVDDAAA